MVFSLFCLLRFAFAPSNNLIPERINIIQLQVHFVDCDFLGWDALLLFFTDCHGPSSSWKKKVNLHRVCCRWNLLSHSYAAQRRTNLPFYSHVLHHKNIHHHNFHDPVSVLCRNIRNPSQRQGDGSFFACRQNWHSSFGIFRSQCSLLDGWKWPLLHFYVFVLIFSFLCRQNALLYIGKTSGFLK